MHKLRLIWSLIFLGAVLMGQRGHALSRTSPQAFCAVVQGTMERVDVPMIQESHSHAQVCLLEESFEREINQSPDLPILPPHRLGILEPVSQSFSERYFAKYIRKNARRNFGRFFNLPPPVLHA